MLTKAADMNDECPSNNVLATAVGASTMAVGANVIKRLEKKGLISVRRGSTRRKVTIASTGKSTCEVITTERAYGPRQKRFSAVKPRAKVIAERPLTPKDRLAEKVAEMGEVKVAAWALRMSPARRDALWAEIVADLGPQAA